MHEVNKQLIALNCGELFPPIVLRRLSEDENDIPRSPKLPIHVVFGADSPGIQLDKYSARENAWTSVKTNNLLKLGNSSVIYRKGKLIFIGRQPVDTVSIQIIPRNQNEFKFLFNINKISYF